MRHIVVYKIILAIGFLTWLTTVAAQKPAIDLISSHHQYRHPESIVDTCFAISSVNSETVFVQAPSVHDQKMKKGKGKKKRRQIGPSFDTIFQKEDSGRTREEKSKAKVSHNNKKFNPLKVFICIIALK